MSEPWEWDESDLIRLRDGGVQESLTLDYKAPDTLAQADAKKREISKDVSALANSAGGTLVYGITENEAHYPDQIKGCDPKVITQEWLEQVINSGIQRRIPGVRIKPVALPQSDPGRVAFVVYVPQSVQAAHQASDKRFYKRYNFQSIPMEEYEIRAVSRRSEAPELSVQFVLVESPCRLRRADGGDKFQPILFQAYVSNSAAQPAEFAVFSVYFDQRLEASAAPGFRRAGEDSLMAGSTPIPVSRWNLNWGNPGKMPIFEGVAFGLFDSPSELRLPLAPGNYVVACQFTAPMMQTRIKVALLHSDGDVVTLVESP